MSENAESTVEFVAGQPVEQKIGADDSSPNENKDAAKEAVKEAIRKAKAEEAGKPKPKPKAEPKESPPAEEAEEDADHKTETDTEEEVHDEPKPKAKPKPKEEEDGDAFSLKRVLKQKERLAQEKREASENFRREQAELENQRQQLAFQQQQIREQAKFLERLRTNPVEAVKEAGWDPEDFVLGLANDGTPEGKQQMLIRQMQDQIRQQQEWQQHVLRQQQEAQQHHQKQMQLQARNSVETRFLARALDEKNKPFTNMFYKGREAALIAEGDILAAQYRHLSGKEAVIEDIADFIEEQLAERANSWYDSRAKSHQVSDEDDSEDGLEPLVDEVEEPKPKARKVGKTLGDESGERRALKRKEISNLDDEELKEEAKAQVKLALARQRKADK